MRRLTLLPLAAALATVLAACTDREPLTGPARDTPPPEFSVVTFGVTRIGLPEDQARPSSINDLAQVAGTKWGSCCLPFLWANGATQVLNSIGSSQANDVNAQGLVVGSVGGAGEEAAAWDNGVLKWLATVYADGDSRARAVNDLGRIVGDNSRLGSPTLGLVWSDASDPSPTTLQSLGGDTSIPFDINNGGTIVGMSLDASGFAHAVVWTDELAAPQALRGFDGDMCFNGLSLAWSVNESGEIAGACRTPAGEHAAYWSSKDATAIDLGINGETSTATSINELGQIVGNSGQAPSRAMLWSREGGGFRRFDLGLPDGSVEATATALNNVGQAVGYAGDFGFPPNVLGVLWSIPVRPALDIAPGNATNTIRLDGRGAMSVAILGSRWLKAADVNPLSLTLGNDDGLDTPVTRRKSTPLTKLTDVNRDGFPDLVAELDERQLMTNGDLAPGTLTLVLLGRLHNGTYLRGTDVIQATP